MVVHHRDNPDMVGITQQIRILEKVRFSLTDVKVDTISLVRKQFSVKTTNGQKASLPVTVCVLFVFTYFFTNTYLFNLVSLSRI